MCVLKKGDIVLVGNERAKIKKIVGNTIYGRFEGSRTFLDCFTLIKVKEKKNANRRVKRQKTFSASW